MNPDEVTLQNGRPDAGQHFFRRIARCHIPTTRRQKCLRIRQSRAIDFSVLIQRQRLQTDQRGRNHIVRETFFEKITPSRRFSVGITRHNVGNQVLLSGLILTRRHDRLFNLGMLGKTRFDLT